MKLRTIIAAAALLSATAAMAEAPKYIFLYIGDGMGMGPVTAAETYNRTILGNDKPLTMMQMPVVGWCMTYSASSPVTDSAAAGTALSTGFKTTNGMLGMTPDSTWVYSIAKTLQQKGYGIGVATSVAPDDATPAAFYAHVPYRSQYYDIDCQMAESDYNFIAGCDLRGAEKDGEDTGVLKRFADNNVQIVRGLEGIADMNADKVLLLNNRNPYHQNDIGYTIDSIPDVLTLPAITHACLAQLERTSPDKFFMMIEGGNIDHALHANDGGAAVKEVLNFDRALKIAFDFYREHPDETLIVVTADHDTGGLTLGKGKGEGIGNIDYQKVSKEAFDLYCKSLLRSRMIYTWDDMKQYLAENLGLYSHIDVTPEQDAQLKEMFERTFELRNSPDQKTLYANFNGFAAKVFDIFNSATGLTFNTTGHSGNPVPVFAVGAHADDFKSFNNNIDIPKSILKALE